MFLPSAPRTPSCWVIIFWLLPVAVAVCTCVFGKGVFLLTILPITEIYLFAQVSIKYYKHVVYEWNTDRLDKCPINKFL